MIRSAVTVCFIHEAKNGPFVFHGDLDGHARLAANLGFDAIELFPPVEGMDLSQIRQVLREFGLSVSAVGTGAGWVQRRWTLTDLDAIVRRQAKQFIRHIIDFSGELGAPAIVGSMQGNSGPATRGEALKWFAEALLELSEYAFEKWEMPLLYEPLNRYESNLINHLSETASWLESISARHVRILSDLFHANIEEANIAEAIRGIGSRLGHVHFADSNREAVGRGHTAMEPIIQALHDIHYHGYLSAEIFPRPTPEIAAQATIDSFRKLVHP